MGRTEESERARWHAESQRIWPFRHARKRGRVVLRPVRQGLLFESESRRAGPGFHRRLESNSEVFSSTRLSSSSRRCFRRNSKGVELPLRAPVVHFRIGHRRSFRVPSRFLPYSLNSDSLHKASSVKSRADQPCRENDLKSLRNDAQPAKCRESCGSGHRRLNATRSPAFPASAGARN